MDAVAALLDGPRARDAFVLRVGMAPPWSIDVADEAPLTAVAVVRGAVWLTPEVASRWPSAPVTWPSPVGRTPTAWPTHRRPTPPS